MTSEEHITAIKAAEDKVREAKKELNDARVGMAIALGKLKVGEVIDVPREAHAFLGRKCRITRAEGHISAFEEDKFLIRYHAIVLRKDGTETQSFADWPEYHR